MAKNTYEDISLEMRETIRYIDKDGKQRTGETVTPWHIGRVDDVRPIDLMPMNERRPDIHPNMYKKATESAISRGAYMRVKCGDVVYQLAVNGEGQPIPMTYTGLQAVRAMCESLAKGAAAWLTDSDVVGYRVTFAPVLNWQARAKGATLASPAPRKKRARANDARKTARKTARANARTARKG